MRAIFNRVFPVQFYIYYTCNNVKDSGDKNHNICIRKYIINYIKLLNVGQIFY